MRVVDDQAGIMGAGKPRDLIERRNVAVHREDALGQDEARPAIALILSQKLGEMGGVAMPVAELAHASRLAAEMHAGVVEAVGEDERLGAEHGPVEQGGEHRGIGLEAGGHEKRRRLALEPRDLPLDPSEEVEIAGDEARGARAGAIAPGPLRPPARSGPGGI